MSDFIQKVEPNPDGIKALLQSQEVMDTLLAEGEKIGSIETSFVGFDRCHVVIKEK